MWWHKRKPPYGQQVIAAQLGEIAELMKMRDKAQDKDERERMGTAAEIAQETLVYMLEEDKRWQATR